MKRLAMLCAVLMMLAASSMAQPGSFITATVPFPFHVGDRHVAAGDCRVAYYAASDLLVVGNPKAQDILAVQTYRIAPNDSTAVPKLLFHKYGETYFLFAVKMPGQKLHRIPPSKSEQDFQSRISIESKIPAENVTVVARLEK